MNEERNRIAEMYSSGIHNSEIIKPIVKENCTHVWHVYAVRCKERQKLEPNATEEIDLLIATDCISEGQNLQDCDYLINYDIHWNPVRIIQRFGRIDRIGSTNKQIQLVNFWPDMDLDEYIRLKERVESRMVMVNVSATGDENIIKDPKKASELEYRKKQLQQLLK